MKQLSRLLLPIALLLLAACASNPSGRSSSGSDEHEVLMERAMERWNLLIAKDAAKAWTYLSPGYRSTHPQKTYADEMSQRPVRWAKVTPYVPADAPEGEREVQAVECDETGISCGVRLKVEFKIRSHLTSVGVVESSTVIKENWIKVKGQWYTVPPDVVR